MAQGRPRGPRAGGPRAGKPRTAPRGAHYRCPVDLTLDVVGGKWKPLILWELRGGTRRFNALQDALPGITHKVLTDQLRQLVRDGILTRTARPGPARHVDYAFSDFGRTLRPVLDAMAGWAKRHHAHVGATLEPLAPPGSTRKRATKAP